MKELIVISVGINTLHSVIKQIKSYVGKEVAIRGYSIEEGFDEDFSGKIVLITGEIVLRLASEQIQDASKVIIARRALRYENIEQLFTLKEKTKILLVNDLKESCLETIEQLKGHGFQSLSFFPYYPGIKTYESCSIAITPGEHHLVPSEISQVIDIGNRQVDITTITVILSELNLLSQRGAVASSEFVSEIIGLTKYLSVLNHKLDHSNLLLTTIFDKFPKALLFCDDQGMITYFNEKIKRLFDGYSLLNANIKDFLGNDFKIQPTYNHEDEIFIFHDHTYIVSIDKVEQDEETICYLIEFENYDIFKRIDTAIRSKLKNKKFFARYDFTHLYSRSTKMIKTLELAKKIAKRDSTVLIQGESGTGKELLAQAIHNASLRTDQPFVAVNFAALSTSVLESELFGYEEGAFTGAKKGGKRGLFEEAHQGTIFMDEIGDAPLDLQVKLLRVLQEGVVRRVGGNEQVPIDIRIIAATNVNLEEKVQEGTFRQDLYYRLNVLPLQTLPLRERREDILLLLHDYINKFSNGEIYHINEYIEKETIEFLQQHPWPGNVRELVNVVEYMVNVKMTDQKIQLSDLPHYLLKEATDQKNVEVKNVSESMLTEEEHVLMIIYLKFGIGRRKIVLELAQRGVNIGEAKVKSIIDSLRIKQLIQVNKGVRGCVVTEEGKKYVNRLFMRK
ncbi:sigma 54-interacting transcriptional regulator [Bacillus sp. RG28]|uniref:Sigma 54-interacting transcriptional regulator n=1 Tax=Gottfriedia endophytica TaxID=2820819 RepID=A0A940NI62_9BACI|nr:sigma 54-interacting transcriptional regulator [Gottfriedia endophytica]MBP0725829.1 sigma 54-interacting transcriptional regulator [Gottfriedia endophytica]